MPVFDVVAVVIVWSVIDCCTGQELYMAESVDCINFTNRTLQIIEKVKHTQHHTPLTPYFFIV
jgi:hypothetical protein